MALLCSLFLLLFLALLGLRRGLQQSLHRIRKVFVLFHMTKKKKYTVTSTLVATIKFQNNLTDELLAEIGSVTVAWSYLERNVEFLLWGLADIEPPESRPFTNTMSMEKRLDTVSALVMLKLPDSGQQEWTRLKEQIKSLKNERNDIVHALWVPNKNNEAKGLKLKVIKKKTLPSGMAEYVHASFTHTVDSIRDLVSRIDQTRNDIQKLGVRSGSWNLDY